MLMGMYGRLRQVTPSALERLESNPEEVEEFINGEPGSVGAAEAALERVKALVTDFQVSDKARDPVEQQKLRALILNNLKEAGVRLPGETPEDGLSIEKSWQVIHYLLTGRTDQAPPPLGNAILGGVEIGQERDYGRIRFLTPVQIREVAEALAAVSRDDLSRHFDLARMTIANVYPRTDHLDIEWVLHYFEPLCRYYADAAANGNAMLLWIE
jgi:Domain of unknown function (DUF1877)